MKFLFDCEDEVCLPAAYRLVDEVKPFIEKVKDIELTEEEAKAGRGAAFKKVLENMMVKYPAETSKIFAKLIFLPLFCPPCSRFQEISRLC